MICSALAAEGIDRLRLSVKKEKPSGFLFRGTTLSNIIVVLVLCKGDSDHLVTWPVT